MYKKTFDSSGLRACVRGITLLELMIVVAIVGILAAIAYPSFQEQVRKTRRADGKTLLLQTAQQLERCYTRFSRYDHASCAVSLPADSAEGFYRVSAPGGVGVSAFTLDAAPLGSQAQDTRCGTLRLTNAGQQGSQGQDTDANDCW